MKEDKAHLTNHLKISLDWVVSCFFLTSTWSGGNKRKNILLYFIFSLFDVFYIQHFVSRSIFSCKTKLFCIISLICLFLYKTEQLNEYTLSVVIPLFLYEVVERCQESRICLCSNILEKHIILHSLYSHSVFVIQLLSYVKKVPVGI